MKSALDLTEDWSEVGGGGEASALICLPDGSYNKSRPNATVGKSSIALNVGLLSSEFVQF